MQLLLVAQEGNAQAACQEALGKLAGEVRHVETLEDAHADLRRTAANGIIIDLKTKMNASKTGKLLAHEITTIYPHALVKWDPEKNELQVMQQAGGTPTLEAFAAKVCQDFPARILRSETRKLLNFNVILSHAPGFEAETIERTVTMNVSRSGCFVTTSSDRWQVDHPLFMLVKELEDRTPIICSVRWHNPWGKRMLPMGVGLHFEKILDTQVAGLLGG